VPNSSSEMGGITFSIDTAMKIQEWIKGVILFEGKVQVKQSHYRPGQALGVPGG